MVNHNHRYIAGLVLAISLLTMLFTPLALAERPTIEPLPQGSPSPMGPGIVEGIVYQDWDQDGEHDPEEPTLAGAMIYLYNEYGFELGRFGTGRDGFYTFVGLKPGVYTLIEEDPFGYSSREENQVTITVTTGVSEAIEVNFGDILLLGMKQDQEQDPLPTFLPAPVSWARR